MEALHLFSVLSLLGRVSRRCISAHILALCSGADGYQGQMPERGHDLGISCHPDMGEEWSPAWAMWTQGRLLHQQEDVPGAPDRWGRGPLPFITSSHPASVDSGSVEMAADKTQDLLG